MRAFSAAVCQALRGHRIRGVDASLGVQRSESRGQARRYTRLSHDAQLQQAYSRPPNHEPGTCTRTRSSACSLAGYCLIIYPSISPDRDHGP